MTFAASLSQGLLSPPGCFDSPSRWASVRLQTIFLIDYFRTTLALPLPPPAFSILLITQPLPLPFPLYFAIIEVFFFIIYEDG
jgi:hypothetical protein